MPPFSLSLVSIKWKDHKNLAILNAVWKKQINQTNLKDYVLSLALWGSDDKRIFFIMLPCVNAKHWGAHKSLHLCLPSWLSPGTPVVMAFSSMKLQNMEHEDERRIAQHSTKVDLEYMFQPHWMLPKHEITRHMNMGFHY